MKKAAVKQGRLRNGMAWERLAALAVTLVLSAACLLDLFLGGSHNHGVSFGVVATTTTNSLAEEPRSPNAFVSWPRSIATVYDNVLPQAQAEWLHTLCSQWNEGTKQHETESKTSSSNTTPNPNPKDLVFEFPLERPETHLPIQRFLNELIWQMLLREEIEVEMKTETKTKRPTPRYYVEYWTRQEWHHILAHQDMDEGWERMLRKKRQDCHERNRKASVPDDAHSHELEDCRGDVFKHPITGQVLYLKVGSKVRGPTVIFDAANGGDLMTRRSVENNSKGESSPSTTTTTTTTTMVSVPAVEGRLLRFKGEKLHAVPRPHDVYWTFDQSQNHIHTEGYERSVLLFNLWNHSTLLVDKILDCGDGKFPTNRTTCYNGEAFGSKRPPPQVASRDTCNPQEEWKHVPILHSAGAPLPQEAHETSLFSLLWEWFFGSSLAQEPFQIPLLGDAFKRGISGYVARMQSPLWWDNAKETYVHPARDNLGQVRLPTRMEIQPDERFAGPDESNKEL